MLCQFLLHNSVNQLAISSVQSLSRVRLFVTPRIAARQASLSITNSQSLLKLMSIESVMPSSHLILCRPLLLLLSIFPSIRVFSNESTLRMRWPKYWSFSFSIYHSFQRTPRIDLLQNGLFGSPCSSRDSQESSPTPHFKSINSCFYFHYSGRWVIEDLAVIYVRDCFACVFLWVLQSLVLHLDF